MEKKAPATTATAQAEREAQHTAREHWVPANLSGNNHRHTGSRFGMTGSGITASSELRKGGANEEERPYARCDVETAERFV